MASWAWSSPTKFSCSSPTVEARRVATAVGPDFGVLGACQRPKAPDKSTFPTTSHNTPESQAAPRLSVAVLGAPGSQVNDLAQALVHARHNQPELPPFDCWIESDPPYDTGIFGAPPGSGDETPNPQSTQPAGPVPVFGEDTDTDPDTGTASTPARSRERLQSASVVLLAGLPHGASPEEEAIDTRLRMALQHAAVAFQVVLGEGERRTQNALRALAVALPKNATNLVATRAYPQRATALQEPQKTAFEDAQEHRWHTWGCENCGNPDCERRLFTGLRG